MYSNEQVQEMIVSVNRDCAGFEPFLGKINQRDQAAIRDVLSDGSVERFDRYDSDVCEEFIRAYETYKKGDR